MSQSTPYRAQSHHKRFPVELVLDRDLKGGIALSGEGRLKFEPNPELLDANGQPRRVEFLR